MGVVKLKGLIRPNRFWGLAILKESCGCGVHRGTSVWIRPGCSRDGVEKEIFDGQIF